MDASRVPVPFPDILPTRCSRLSLRCCAVGDPPWAAFPPGLHASCPCDTVRVTSAMKHANAPVRIGRKKDPQRLESTIQHEGWKILLT